MSSACPGSRRGHTWRPVLASVVELALRYVPRDVVLAARVCARCGASGRVDSQGRVVADKAERIA